MKKLESDLKQFAERSIPFATKKTLNDSAFAARAISQADIKTRMVNRNKFTMQSIRVEQTKTLQISRQTAVVGSTADYMEDQEFGAIKTKKGKEGVGIATSYAAGQGMNNQPRTRLPRKANTMAQIQLSKGRKKTYSKKQRNLVAIKEAAGSGRKFVFLDLDKSKGIFKVIGGVKRAKLRMVRDMSSGSVRIPKNPWLEPAFNEAKRMQPAFYADALRFQARKHGLFK
jgi:hypothetical protein